MVTSGRVSATSREKMMASRRREEDSALALMGYVSDATKLQIAAQSETTIPQRRRLLRAQQLEAERRLQELEKAREASIAARELENWQSEALASEFEKRNGERERREREVARICGESEELRELEAKLKVAYVNKERAAQHEEKLAMERQNLLREHAMEEEMDERRAAEDAEERVKVESSKTILAQQKEALQEQMMERERLKREGLEEAKRDREMVDEVVRRIQEEDDANWRVKSQRKQETRNLIQSYEAQRAMELEEARLKQREEEEEIRRHAQVLSRRQAEQRRLAEEKKARDAENFRRIVAETEKQRHEEKELQDLRDLLWEEEMEAARAKEQRDREEKRLAMKRDMAIANQRQLEAKEERKKQEEEEEIARLEQMRKRREDEEALEREREEERQQEKLKYIQSVQQQKEDRLRTYEIAKQAELETNLKDAEQEEYRKRVVAEARRRLLAEHAANLQGYLPKGVDASF